jgi:hypothetical protein
MAFFEDMFKGGNIGSGVAVGIGAALVGPLVTPVIGGVLRPVGKAVVKAGLLAYDAGREGLMRLNEATGDVVGEARVEIERDRRSAAGEPGGPATTRTEQRAAGAAG